MYSEYVFLHVWENITVKIFLTIFEEIFIYVPWQVYACFYSDRIDLFRLNKLLENLCIATEK